MSLEYQKEIKTEEYRVCSVSVTCVRLKEEPDVEHEYDSSEASACVNTVKEEPGEHAEYSESTVAQSLYAGHDIKDELVPELLQPLDRAFSQPIQQENKEVISENASRSTEYWGHFKNSHVDVGLRACSVRLERLPVHKNNKATSAMFSENAIIQDKNEIETKPEVCTESDICAYGSMHKRFPLKQSLIPYTSHSPKKKGVKCEICLRKFTSFKYLVRHLQIHISKNIHQCKICKKKFVYKASLLRHMENHKPKEIHHQISQNDKLYKCEICLKTFCKNFLKLHYRKHERQAQLKCKYCNKQVAKLSRLIEHERIHTGEKPYKCNICLRGFARKRYAATHYKNCKNRERNSKSKLTSLYECDICMQLFRRSECLINHKRIHTGERPYQCLICMKRFSSNGGLYLHTKRKHELYTCDACREQFKDKDKLRVHIHCLCESLCCAMCGVRCEGRGPLRRHARAHIGAGPEGAQSQEQSVAPDYPPKWKTEPGWIATGPALK